MFYSSFDIWPIIVAVILYGLLIAAALFGVYLLIRTAIKNALNSHYRTVRTYEATGHWLPGYSVAPPERRGPAAGPSAPIEPDDTTPPPTGTPQ